ncbi:MAG: murein biosynthesis integral membrane protein MurJ [Firmicutes bacterium]|nr:murein biosynthesis integral membrane protein MurJ [Bacillota bacterium]
MKSQSLRRSTLWIFCLTALSRLLGFVRTIALATLFGTEMQTDAWVMASALPNLLFGSVNQAITVSTVPAVTAAEAQESRAQFQQFLNQVWTLILLIAVAMTLVGEGLAPEIVSLVAPGFHGAERHLTIVMTRIMIPAIVFWGASGLLTGILQSRENYFGMTLSPLMLNVVQIFGILVLGHWFHIVGAAWGFTLAVASQLLVLWPLLRRHGLSLRLTRRFDHPRLRPLLKLMGPYFVVSSAGNIELLTDRMLASAMPTGSISAMNYAFTVSQVPLGLIITPLITPIFTRLAQHHAHQHREAFRALAIQGVRWVLLLALPVSLVLFVLNVPILRGVFEHGAFNRTSLWLTSHIFLYAILALPAVSLTTYLQQVSYATQNTSRPARYSLIGVLTNIAGNLLLTRWLGVYGLVLATAIANWTNLALLLKTYSLRWHLRRQRDFLTALALSGSAMALTLLGLSTLMNLNHVYGLGPLIVGVLFTAGTALLIYGSLLLALGVPEARQAGRYAIHVARRLAAG